MNPPTEQINRFIAIDAHKHYLVIGGLDAHMEIVLPLRRVDIHRIPDWARKPRDVLAGCVGAPGRFCLEGLTNRRILCMMAWL